MQTVINIIPKSNFFNRIYLSFRFRKAAVKEGRKEKKNMCPNNNYNKKSIIK